MNSIVTTNLGHLKIYQIEKDFDQTTPTLRLVAEESFPEAHSHYDDIVTDQAGRFPISNGSNSGGMSIGEENDFEIEIKRRLIEKIAAKIGVYLQTHPKTDWGFAAPSSINKAILEKISLSHKKNLRKNLEKDFTKLLPSEVLNFFQKNKLVGVS